MVNGLSECDGEGVFQLENSQEDGVLLPRHLSLLVFKQYLEDFLIVEREAQ